MGLEVSGEVVALGEGATRWQLGDKICALTNGGAYAEYVTVPEGQALPIPKGYTLLQAAALARKLFHRVDQCVSARQTQSGRKHFDSWRLLWHWPDRHSTGARFWRQSFCTVGNADKVAACVKVGADVAIDYKTQDYVEEVLKLTDQKGVNAILDMVGGSYMQRNLRALAIEGRLLQIAFLQPSKVEVDWVSLMAKRLTFTGSTLRPRSAADKAQIANELQEQVWPLLAAGTVAPVIYKVFDLNEAAQAHALMESSQHIGKIMLTVAGE